MKTSNSHPLIDLHFLLFLLLGGECEQWGATTAGVLIAEQATTTIIRAKEKLATEKTTTTTTMLVVGSCCVWTFSVSMAALLPSCQR
jgi:hypothetical protein